MGNEYSRSRGGAVTHIPWLWVGILGAIIVTILIARSVSSGDSVDTDRAHLMVSPQDNMSTVFISMTSSSKNRITGTGSQPLYVGDTSISVETGGARATDDDLAIDLDERTELIYTSHSNTGDLLKLTKGKIWISQLSQSSTVELKNLSATISEGSTALLEQNNQIYSTVYAIHGDTEIHTTAGSYTLKSGDKIMISASDIANPGIQISSLAGSIDEGITTNTLFVRNNGAKILSTLSDSTNTTVSSGTLHTGATTTNQDAAISILEPLDGSIATKSSIAIRGSIDTSRVARVTLNDIDAIVSPVNATFTFSDFALTSEINNIVYKAYGADGGQITKGVFTIFGSKQALQNATRLLPNASPISSKEFRISTPSANPYVMTDRAIKVQGTVPKDTVSYIMVNDYRLQKFVPNSTSWYYFANMDSGTLQDGINLYSIKFYSANKELLYTQLFTIIKESKNATLSGEASR